MSYKAYYVDDGKGVHKIGRGIVTGLEIHVSSLHESSVEERARKLRYGLIDFSEVTELKITTAEIHQLVEVNRKMAAFTPGAVVAIIAPTAQPYAMSRMWSTLSESLGWKTNVFHNRPDAIAWLKKELLSRDGSSATLDQFPSLELAHDARPE